MGLGIFEYFTILMGATYLMEGGLDWVEIC